MSMTIREMAPAVPAKKVRSEAVNPSVEVEIQPRPVEICGLVGVLPGQSMVGSK